MGKTFSGLEQWSSFPVSHWLVMVSDVTGDLSQRQRAVLRPQTVPSVLQTERSSDGHLGLAACAVVLGLAALLVMLGGHIVELLHRVSSSGGKGLPLGGCLVHG